jgi:hypothetical protein
MPTHTHPRPPMSIHTPHAHPCLPTLIHAHPCPPTPIHAHPHPSMPAHTHLHPPKPPTPTYPLLRDFCEKVRPVREGVSTDSLKFHAGPPCPTLIRPAGGPLPKRPYGRLGGGPPAGQAACDRLLPPWIPHAVRAWRK